MKFFVTRTSQFKGEKPCDEATPAQRAFSFGGSPKAYEAGWLIEINTLEELMAFSSKHGALIVRGKDDFYCDDEGSIEIYDDYRE